MIAPNIMRGGGPRDSNLQVTLQVAFLPLEAADFVCLADVVNDCQSVVINHTKHGFVF